MRLFDIVRRTFAKAEDVLHAALETHEETTARRAGMPTYSRHEPNPSWGKQRPGPGDRVVGRQVVRDGRRPPGQTIGGAIAALGFEHEYASGASDAIGGDFFAARQALADRKR